MTQTRWLTDREQRAWRALLAMNSELMARLHRQLQVDSGLSGADFEVLVHLTDTDSGRLRAYVLAEALQWEKSRLSHHLGRMEKRGLIKREGCPEDARGSFIVLTPQGREVIDQAAPGHVETVRDLVFDQLTSDEVDQLARITGKVRGRISETG